MKGLDGLPPEARKMGSLQWRTNVGLEGNKENSWGARYTFLVLRCGKIPPVVRTAVPVDGRFEHIVLSCNATSDHAIIWIMDESQRALDLMLARDRTMDIPANQRMEGKAIVEKEHSDEHRAAVQRAIALDVPQSYSPSYGTFHEIEESENSARSLGTSSYMSSKRSQKNWDELVGRLFDTDESGQIISKKPYAM